jgi:hypothetical protein
MFLLINYISSFSDKDVNQFNKYNSDITNNNLDFVLLHYLCKKSDTKFWNHITNNILRSPARLNLNGIAGDPAPGVSKKLFINYSINGVQYQDQFSEYLFDQVVYDLINADQFNGWYQVDINTHNSRLFNYFLKNIKFTDLFIKFSNSALLIDKHNKYTLMTDLDKTKKIDVIHLRLEPDMTYNMSVHNNMNEIDYIKKLENNYIELIKKYFSKDNIIIILCYTKDNEVTKFLKENGYDGIIQTDANYGRTNDLTTYVAIKPNQIKSVKNDGSWDINDNNIYS